MGRNELGKAQSEKVSEDSFAAHCRRYVLARWRGSVSTPVEIDFCLPRQEKASLDCDSTKTLGRPEPHAIGEILDRTFTSSGDKSSAALLAAVLLCSSRSESGIGLTADEFSGAWLADEFAIFDDCAATGKHRFGCALNARAFEH